MQLVFDDGTETPLFEAVGPSEALETIQIDPTATIRFISFKSWGLVHYEGIRLLDNGMNVILEKTWTSDLPDPYTGSYWMEAQEIPQG